MDLPELFKVIIIGIVEGVTEWLPISSTGHMILINEIIKLDVSDSFLEMFLVVIQLGAICAVPTLFYDKIFPLGKSRDERRPVFELWKKVFVGIIPAVATGLIFEIFGIEEYINKYLVVATMLIIYGIAFLIMPKIISGRKNFSEKTELCIIDAFKIGIFQALSLIPGTSRSGATMLGGMALGYDAVASAEFSFFMAIPVMLGASLVKVLKFALSGFAPTAQELVFLTVGMAVSYAVSMASIRFLLEFVKKRGVRAFGIYRIVLGLIVIILFLT